jgi:hypothetical protein
MLSTLELSELPEVPVHEVAWSNADLQFFARRVYRFAGLQVRFGRQGEASAVAPSAKSGVWMALAFAGQELVLQCSQACAQTVLQAQGWSLEGLSPEALQLMGQTRLAPVLPDGVVLRSLSFASNAMLSPGLVPMGTWAARHASTQEPSEISMRVWAPPGFAFYAFAKAWDAWLLGHEKPRFAALPWTLPLVCARWSTDAADIEDLAVGDVLLIGA